MNHTSVVDGYTRNIGADPEDTFKLALEKNGADSRLGSDGQYISNCPAHDDRKASLHWQQTPNKKVIFHCFAGCEFDEILRGLALRDYQLRPVRSEYDYFDAIGTYRFTVKRVNTADGSKGVTQVRKLDDGTELDGNGLDQGESFFWLEPELEVLAEDARAAGRKITVWLPEGEKDVIAIAGSGILTDWDFVTTAPGGARNWKQVHTDRIRELANRGVLERVVVVCDPDQAGVNRGYRIREVLGQAVPDLPVRVLKAEGDVADLCDQYRAAWIEMGVTELDEESITEALEEGSAVTGFMLRDLLGAGTKPGRRGMAIRMATKDGDVNQMVLIGEVIPVEAWDTGWTVEVTGPRADPIQLTLTHHDLVTKAGFDRWLAKAGIAMVPRCGFGADTVASSLRVWLAWWTATHRVPRITVTDYLTWVDPETGEPATSIESGREPVFVTPEDVVGSSEGGSPVRWIGVDKAGCAWGKEGTELDAAWAMARVLSFGDRESVIAICGWVGAIVLAPWLGRYLPTKPGLALIAPSGSGKTHGAGRLLLQLTGCKGQSTTSVAGLRRRLAQGGVSAIQWVDDSAVIEDHNLKEILRTAASGTEHTLANPDAGTRATDSARLVGAVVVSAEGVGWEGETAMQDRFLFVRPTNPQSRTSLRTDRDGELQWLDVQDLLSEYNHDLTRVSRWVVEGVSHAGEVRAFLDEWARTLVPPKGRGDVPAFMVAMGARAVGAWLVAAKRRAGDDWPGNQDPWTHPIYNNWRWLVNGASEQLVAARDRGPARNVLVSTVIPAILRSELRGISGKAMTSMVVSDVDTTSEDNFRDSLWHAVGVGGGIESAMPAVVVDREDRIWVWAAGLADWYEKRFRGQGETRVTSAKALSDQLTVVEDNPDWAVWVDQKGAGRTYERTGCRVGKRGAGKNRAVYRRLNEESSKAVLDRAD